MPARGHANVSDCSECEKDHLPRHSRGGGNPGLYSLLVFYGVSPPNDEVDLLATSRRARPYISAKGPNNGRALRDAPCTVMPHSTSLDELEAGFGREGELAKPVLSLAEGLRQGPPVHESVHSWGRTAGIC